MDTLSGKANEISDCKLYSITQLLPLSGAAFPLLKLQSLIHAAVIPGGSFSSVSCIAQAVLSLTEHLGVTYRHLTQLTRQGCLLKVRLGFSHPNTRTSFQNNLFGLGFVTWSWVCDCSPVLTHKLLVIPVCSWCDRKEGNIGLTWVCPCLWWHCTLNSSDDKPSLVCLNELWILLKMWLQILVFNESV